LQAAQRTTTRLAIGSPIGGGNTALQARNSRKVRKKVRDIFGPVSGQAATTQAVGRSILFAMRLARVLGAIGRGLISAGVIVLLFVAYQLWGTGLQHSAAQGDLGDEFQETTGIEDVASDAVSLAEAARASQEAIGAGQIVASEPAAATSDADDDAPTETSDDSEEPGEDLEAPTPTGAELLEANFDVDERQAIVAKLYPEAGKPLARINIPDINVDQITVEGVSVEDLRKGPGHYQSTPNPGQAGNSAIAGHRTTYGAPFHRVDELNPGDPIFVTTAQGVFEYRVVGYDENGQQGGDLGYFIVSPSDTWVLDQTEGENTLTLTACHPKYSARQRIIVRAELVGEPAPTIPRDEAVDLGPISIDSGSADERASEADAVDGDAEIPDEEQVIIGDDVAADDDPSVDADGNPLEDADQEAADDDASDDTAAEEDVLEETEVAANEDTTETADDSQAVAAGDDGATDEPAIADVEEDVAIDDSDFELTSAQTPFNTGGQDFGEGLNGDPTKVRPAIMWGISGLFIWIAAWFMGKRLDRKWTLYAMGFVPFAFVLWSTFVNVDQALPSY